MQIVSKTEIMRRVAQGDAHEAFTHSIDGVFDITLMRRWAKANLDPVRVDLADFIDFVRANRDIDEARVSELTNEEALNDPGMFVQYDKPGDGIYHLHIDGVHRALRLYSMGIPYQWVWIVPEAAIIRPSPLMRKNPWVDWGKEFIDGRLVER